MASYLTPPIKQVIALQKKVEPSYTPNATVKILRSGERSTLVDGPMSQKIASALDEIYAKEKDEATGIVLETQAIDTQLAAGIWLAMSNKGTLDPNAGSLYGVQQNVVSVNDVVSFNDTASAMTDEQKENSALVILPETSEDGVLKTTLLGYITSASPYANVIANSARKHGVRVFTSMEAYAKHILNYK